MKSRAALPLSLLLLGWSPATRTAGAAPPPPRLDLTLPAGPQRAGGAVDVGVVVSGAAALSAFELEIEADPALLTLKGMTLSDRLGKAQGCDPARGACVLALGPARQQGVSRLGAVVYGRVQAPPGDGLLATLHFQGAGQAGPALLRFVRATLVDPGGQPVAPTWKNATLTLVP